jgi:hypothetical protein
VAIVVLFGVMLIPLAGALSLTTGYLVLGERISILDAWRRSFAVVPTQLGAGGIVASMLATVWGLYLVAGMSLRVVTSGAIVAAYFVVAGLLSIGVTSFLVLSFVLVEPVIVLERAGVQTAMRRSRFLVRGHRWRIGSILAAALLGSGAISGIAYVPFQVIAVLTAGNPLKPSAVSVAVSITGRLISLAAAIPVCALLACLTYVDIRIRKEKLSDMTLDAKGAENLTNREWSEIWRPDPR